MTARQAQVHPANTTREIRTWNRRFHVFSGLYFLLFLWLFAISGLLLNHSDWSLAEFWPQREESSADRQVNVPASLSGDVAIAEFLMTALALEGELNRVERRESGEFRFQVSRPGRNVLIEADLGTGNVNVMVTDVNAAGVLDALHHFTGVRADDPAETRDWILTRLRSLAMDALAVGMAVLVVSGVYMWWRRRSRRLMGIVAFGLGTLCCAGFIFIIPWIV